MHYYFLILSDNHVMPKTPIALAFSIVVALAFSACAPSIDFISSGKSKSSKQTEDRMVLFQQNERYTDKCISLGEIRVYDGFLTAHCDFDLVLRKVYTKAREVGADAVKILKVHQPDSISSCYRIEALALAFNGPGPFKEDELLASADTAFLSFPDAFPCGSYNDTTSTPTAIKRVILFPFSAYTLYDNGTAFSTGYELTVSRIRSHLLKLLNGVHVEVDQVTKMSRSFAEYSQFYQAVVEKATLGKGSPLGWGGSVRSNLVDPGSVFYIPVAIERESQRQSRGRFYVLVANNRGQIVASRNFEFDPEKWSMEFNSFANEVEGKLPIVGK
jgi:hypothetical protein